MGKKTHLALDSPSEETQRLPLGPCVALALTAQKRQEAQCISRERRAGGDGSLTQNHLEMGLGVIYALRASIRTDHRLCLGPEC